MRLMKTLFATVALLALASVPALAQYDSAYAGGGVFNTTITAPNLTITNAISTTSGNITAGDKLVGTNGAYLGFTGTHDRILIVPVAKGAAQFDGTISSADLTGARQWTLPNLTGTFALMGTSNTGTFTTDNVTAGTFTGHLLDTAFVTPVNALAGTAELTYVDATDVTAGKTIVVGNVTYTFVSPLTPAEGEVLIAGTADGTMTNLKNAINHTGTPDTDYKVAVANPDIVASIVTGDDSMGFTARVKGVIGNSFALSSNETTFTIVGFSTTPTGVDGTIGAKGDLRFDTTYMYFCVAANGTADRNWRRVDLGSAY